MRPRIGRFALAAVLSASVLALGGVAFAGEPKSGSKSGVASVQCPSDPSKPVCGTRIRVQGPSSFTLTPAKPIDLDVFFYDGKGELTDQFTTAGCEIETGQTSPEARFAVVVIPERSTCGNATSVGFTYTYTLIAKRRCPDINASCRPFWANIAAFVVLALLLGPVVVLAVVSATRRARGKRAAQRTTS